MRKSEEGLRKGCNMSAAKTEKSQKVESETLANHFRFLSEFPAKCYSSFLTSFSDI